MEPSNTDRRSTVPLAYIRISMRALLKFGASTRGILCHSANRGTPAVAFLLADDVAFDEMYSCFVMSNIFIGM